MTFKMENLSFKYADHLDYLFKDISLTISPGEFTIIKGESGIGKSTLFNIMCGVIPNIVEGIINGQVTYEDKSISQMDLVEISRFAGVVFQDPDTQLFMPTVEDEIAFGLENLATPFDEISRRLDRILKENELENLININPKLCSGGEKQLIVFSSVIIMDRPILLLDESFSQIDDYKCQLIRRQLIKLIDEGKAVALIDHQDHYDDIAKHIYYLKDKNLIKTR